MSESTLNLARMTFDLEETMVTVISKVDMPDLRMDRITIRLVKDNETQVPLWVAEVLEEQDAASIKRDHTVSHGYMARIAHKESERRGLESLDDSFFFRRSRLEIKRLKQINTGTALRRLTSIEGNFNKLLRLRFKKLLNIVMLDNQLDGNLALSEEEKWLYTQLHEIFTTWQENAGISSDSI